MADEHLPAYTRLAISRFGLTRLDTLWLRFFAGVCSLWLGRDHLLLVTNHFGVERYRRWFFKDIQAFIVHRNSLRLVWNLIVGGCGLLIAAGTAACIIGALDADSTDDRRVFTACAIVLGGLMMLCLGFVLVNTLLGPSCTTYVQTPLGVEKMTMPGRLNSFAKIAATLAPLIEAVQTTPSSQAAPFVADALAAPEAPPAPQLE